MHSHQTKKFLLAGLTAASLLTAGAVFAQGNAAPQNSGFLSDYSKLKAVEGVEGTFRHIDTTADLRPYTKLLLEPVEVFIAANPEYKGLQPDAIKRMSDAFRQAFVDATKSGYQIVQAPGPDVLRIRLAITGVQPTKPPLGPTDFIPIKVLFNAGRAAAGASPKVAEIAAEIEIIDPAGKVVMAGTSTRKSSKTLPQGEKITWNDMQDIVNVWAKNLRTQLDTARGVAK